MTATSSFRKAAVGLRCHSGWAAAILLCGNRHEFTVLERYRLELCDSGIGGARQPYHHAESLPLADATAFIARSAVSAKDLADVALGSILKAATNRKLAVAGCGILSASGRKLPPLKDILASHALIHAAEGELYRDAISVACRGVNVEAIRIRERDIFRQASDHTGLSEATILARLASVGRSLGPPWTQDQKLATLAAWILL